MNKHEEALDVLSDIIDKSNSKIFNFISRLYVVNAGKSPSNKSEMERIGGEFIIGMNLLKMEERSKTIKARKPKKRRIGGNNEPEKGWIYSL